MNHLDKATELAKAVAKLINDNEQTGDGEAIFSATKSQKDLQDVCRVMLKNYNNFKSDEEREQAVYVLANTFYHAVGHGKGGAFSNDGLSYDPKYDNEQKGSLTKLYDKTVKFIEKSWANIQKGFTYVVFFALGVSLIGLLTIIIMNKKLDKFIRLLSDMAYETSKAVKEILLKSIGALMSLSLVDFLNEFFNGISKYIFNVKRILDEIKQEGLDGPLVLLLGSIGLIITVLCFKYFEYFEKQTGQKPEVKNITQTPAQVQASKYVRSLKYV